MAVARARYRLVLGSALRGAPGLPAQAVALVALLYLAATEGGYYAIDWYPVGLVLLALVAVWGLAVPRAGPPSRATLAALVLFGLFAAWSLCSVAWADEASAAWEGGNRALLYAALFGLFSLWTVGAREARWLLGLFGLGVALLGLVELLRFAAAGDPGEYLLGGRLAEPVGYQNGNVALWVMGALACLWLAASREPHPVIRGLGLGGTSLLGSLALMGQSRGALFALPVALLLFLALAPGRLRLLAALAAVAPAVALAAGPVLDLVDGAESAALPRLVDDAARAIVLPSALLAALGAAAALADLRWTPPAETVRRTRVVAAAVLGVAALALAGVALARAGDLRVELSERWEEFKSGEEAEEGTARLGSGSTNRYDFWTVAWESFEREPLRGVGSDNFQQDYLARGSTREKPRFPHSLELAVLSQTGVVGGLLFAGGLGAALAAALALRRRLAGAAAGAVAAALAVFLYWLLHASVDWLYELPALGGLAFALLGLATAVRDEEALPRRARLPARVAAPLLAAAAALSFVPLWLAEREIDRATEIWRESPTAAYDRLERAADLNRVSARPALLEGTIALRVGQPTRAERAFREALRREPRNAYAWLELAALASSRGDRAEARRRIERAVELDPRDEATRLARERIAAGERITPREVNRAVVKNARGAGD
jgi:tetratricopeptide (TPR) repeat protein